MPPHPLVTAVVIGGLAKEAIDRLDIRRLLDVGLPQDFNEIVVVAVIVAARSLVGASALWLLRDRINGKAVVRLMVGLMTLTAVGVAMLAQIDVLALAALGLVLHGGSWVASEPIVAAWTNTFASSRQRATVHSFVGQAEAFGEIGGGIALGVVAQAAGVPTAMTISAILFGLAALVMSRAHHRWDESVALVDGDGPPQGPVPAS
ncbi:MAG: MFS transporter [Actinobacteria bacterium]|nr:MFS transporter [Actinomycetota bacterium]